MSETSELAVPQNSLDVGAPVVRTMEVANWFVGVMVGPFFNRNMS